MSLNRIKATVVFLLLAMALFLVYTAFAGTESEPGGSGDPLVSQSYVDQYVQWNVVELNQGQVLKGQAGLELIVRRGQALVVDPVGNGIPDLTSGTDISAGSAVPVNHLMLIPREDGRGVKATSPVVAMYRGGVNIR